MAAIFNTTQLQETMREVRPEQGFFTRTFFPQVITFETRSVIIEQVADTRRAAPFRMPKVQAPVAAKSGYFQRELTPAYVKDACVICPTDLLIRNAGEALLGSMTPTERLNILTVQEQIEMAKRLDMRLELMAVEALRSATLTISGFEKYPDTSVDFYRDADLDVNVTSLSNKAGTGNALVWTDANSNPLDNIEEMSARMARTPFGAPATDMILTNEDWKLLRRHQDVCDLIDRDKEKIDVTRVRLGPLQQLEGVQYVGTLSGWLDIWVSAQWYENDDGTISEMLPEGEVLLVNRGALMGQQLFGAIMNLEGMMATRQYFSSDLRRNPSGLELIAESAPLVAPKAPNASARINVRA